MRLFQAREAEWFTCPAQHLIPPAVFTDGAARAAKLIYRLLKPLPDEIHSVRLGATVGFVACQQHWQAPPVDDLMREHIVQLLRYLLLLRHEIHRIHYEDDASRPVHMLREESAENAQVAWYVDQARLPDPALLLHYKNIHHSPDVQQQR